MVASELVPDRSAPDVRALVEDVQLGVVRLGSLTLDAIHSGTEALVGGDVDHARRVEADDDVIDSLRHAVEDECLRIIAQPGLCASDLRFVGVALRIVHELERSADLMVNVARTTSRLHPDRLDGTAGPLVERMSRQVILQLRMAVNAFVDRDPSWAAALADMDDTTTSWSDASSATCSRSTAAHPSTTPGSTPRCRSRW